MYSFGLCFWLKQTVSARNKDRNCTFCCGLIKKKSDPNPTRTRSVPILDQGSSMDLIQLLQMKPAGPENCGNCDPAGSAVTLLDPTCFQMTTSALGHYFDCIVTIFFNYIVSLKQVTNTKGPMTALIIPCYNQSSNPTTTCINYFQVSMWDQYKKQRDAIITCKAESQEENIYI